MLGFDGKWAIHPSQAPIANEVFSPTPDEVTEARQARWRPTVRRRPAASVPSVATGSPPNAAHTAGSPPTPCTRPRWRWVGGSWGALGVRRVRQGIGVPDGQRVRAASRPPVRTACHRVHDLRIPP